MGFIFLFEYSVGLLKYDTAGSNPEEFPWNFDSTNDIIFFNSELENDFRSTLEYLDITEDTRAPLLPSPLPIGMLLSKYRPESISFFKLSELIISFRYSSWIIYSYRDSKFLFDIFKSSDRRSDLERNPLNFL